MGVENVIGLVAQHGGLLGLALFAIWMLNKVWEARVEEAKANAEEKAVQRQELLEVVKANTAVMTRLCERLGDVGDSKGD